MVRVYIDGEYEGGGTAGENVGRCPIKSGMTGRAAGDKRGRPRKRPKTRTGGGEPEGSSVKKAENADGWWKIAGVIREKGRKRGRHKDIANRKVAGTD